MLIHGAVQFIQFLLADSGEYAERVVSEIFSQFDRSCHVVIFDVRGARFFLADSPANHPEYQTEPEHIDFELAEKLTTLSLISLSHSAAFSCCHS